MYALALLGLRCSAVLSRGRRGTCCTAGGLMYALALLGLRCSAAAFAWQAWDLLHCRGSDVRFGAPWSPLLCRCFRVAGVGLGAPAGGV